MNDEDPLTTIRRTVSDPELTAQLERLGDARRAVTEAEEARQEAAARRDEIEAEVRELREEARVVEKEAGRDRLVPGANPSAAVAEAGAQVRKLEQRAEELDARLDTRREDLLEARQARGREAEKLVRRLGKHVRQGLEEMVNSWSLVVTAERPFPEIYRTEVLPAERRWRLLHRGLRRAIGMTDSGVVERKELKSYLEEVEMREEARLGYLLTRLAHWSRLRKSPVRSLWEDLEGVPLREGSVITQSPLPALPDTVATLGRGAVPVDLTL